MAPYSTSTDTVWCGLVAAYESLDCPLDLLWFHPSTEGCGLLTIWWEWTFMLSTWFPLSLPGWRVHSSLAGTKVPAPLVLLSSHPGAGWGVPRISQWSWKARLLTWPLLVGLWLRKQFYSVWWEYTRYCLRVFCLAWLSFPDLLTRESKFILDLSLSAPIGPPGLQALQLPVQGTWDRRENPGNLPSCWP